MVSCRWFGQSGFREQHANDTRRNIRNNITCHALVFEFTRIAYAGPLNIFMARPHYAIHRVILVSVCLSVCLSVTLRYRVKMNKHIFHCRIAPSLVFWNSSPQGRLIDLLNVNLGTRKFSVEFRGLWWHLVITKGRTSYCKPARNTTLLCLND